MAKINIPHIRYRFPSPLGELEVRLANVSAHHAETNDPNFSRWTVTISAVDLQKSSECVTLPIETITPADMAALLQEGFDLKPSKWKKGTHQRIMVDALLADRKKVKRWAHDQR